MPRAALLLALLGLCACKPADHSPMKAIVGAVLIDGAGGPPVSDSVVAVAGGVIQMAGPRGGNPLPAEADKIDGSGQYIVPGLIDVYPLGGAKAGGAGAVAAAGGGGGSGGAGGEGTGDGVAAAAAGAAAGAAFAVSA